MDLPGSLKIIDQALAAIDEFDGVYRKALDNQGPTFRKYWDQALEVEQTAVLPRLELARQIAAHVGADELPITSPPNKRMGKSHPFQVNRAALVTLRTRLAEREKMASVLGPAGPQLSTSSLHNTIWDAAARLFDGGHYRQAVQTAGQALESHLQTIAGAEVAGQDLAKLFAASGDGVRLHFAELDPNGKTHASVREGAASLIRGAMMGVRNLVSHPEWQDPSESEALEMLAVLSYIAHLVDRAEPVIPEGAGRVKGSCLIPGVTQDGSWVLPPECRRAPLMSPGFKVERPQAQPRTNDLDAGEERRRLLEEEVLQLKPGILSSVGKDVVAVSRSRGRSGRAARELGCRSSLRRDEACMERCGHSQVGSIKRATSPDRGS